MVDTTIAINIQLLDANGVPTSIVDSADVSGAFIINLDSPSNVEVLFSQLFDGTRTEVTYSFQSEVAQTADVTIAGVGGGGCPSNWDCSDTVQVEIVPGIDDPRFPRPFQVQPHSSSPSPFFLFFFGSYHGTHELVAHLVLLRSRESQGTPTPTVLLAWSLMARLREVSSRPGVSHRRSTLRP